MSYTGEVAWVFGVVEAVPPEARSLSTCTAYRRMNSQAPPTEVHRVVFIRGASVRQQARMSEAVQMIKVGK
jgi:hypothetical protein